MQYSAAKSVDNDRVIISDIGKISANGTDQFDEFSPVFDQVVTHVQHLTTTCSTSTVA